MSILAHVPCIAARITSPYRSLLVGENVLMHGVPVEPHIISACGIEPLMTKELVEMSNSTGVTTEYRAIICRSICGCAGFAMSPV
jgi:hypothetical protein